ncbi:MAG: hypothetical protein ACLQVA_13195 [Candidatus Brocadiia bacterium]
MSRLHRSYPWFLIAAGFMCVACAFAATRTDAAAKAAFPAQVPQLRGVVLSVDSATGSLIIATEVTRGVPGPDVWVFTNSQTVILIDGSTGVFAMLRPGMFVTVVPPSGVAVLVDAHTNGPAQPAPETDGIR